MIEQLPSLIPDHVLKQRWFAGDAADKVEVVDSDELRGEWPKLVWALTDIDGALYQLVLGGRPLGEHAGFLQAHESGVFGEIDGAFWYDATLDPELALVLLDVFSGGQETADRVRPMGVEQSNSSLVFDDRLIAKLFRRVHPGRNLDVEVTTALAEAGFAHVAEPVAAWERDGNDLAFVQQFLAGGAEGWALALTSLRDFFASGEADPAEAGGDFAGEANRLGRVTAEMHVAMAQAFGSRKGDPGLWAGIMRAGLSVLDGEPEQRAAAERVIDRLAAVRDAGAAIRVHGDYHLGQTMRTDSGWYVLDFEGEPARPLEERRVPSSPMKDVTGMLRSIDYAARSVLTERDRAEVEKLEPLATAWGLHNRDCFLAGYLATEGVETLLPSNADAFETVLGAFELEKAVYELGYELAYRPTWADIPRSAISRLTSG